MPLLSNDFPFTPNNQQSSPSIVSLGRVGIIGLINFYREYQGTGIVSFPQKLLWIYYDSYLDIWPSDVSVDYLRQHCEDHHEEQDQ